MQVYAAVLQAFQSPLVWQAFETAPLQAGELLIQVQAAGICGSDLHMWQGHDPRTPLPIILGHEAVGQIAAIGAAKQDILGRELREGDLVAWDRGVVCGACYACVVRKQPYLCSNRKVYGINMGCSEPPYLLGGYAQYMHLLARTNVLRIDADIDPAVLVPASCSGATAAHAIEACQLRPGHTVIIQGPGPLGLFATALARERGAGRIIVVGTARSRWKLDMATDFGASDLIAIGSEDAQARLDQIMALTDGRGADAVIECSGSRAAMDEGLNWTARGGTYALAGVAVPVGETAVSTYEQVILKNVNVQGIWVSDTSHFYQAAQLVIHGRYPFGELVTHRFPLEEADAGMQALKRREVLKAVLVP